MTEVAPAIDYIDHRAEHLRLVRAQLIPQVPTITSGLREDDEVLRTAIHLALIDQQIDPTTIHERDLNKLERQILAGFAIGCLRSYLVVGSGRNAQFIDFPARDSLKPTDQRDTLSVFCNQIRQLQKQAAHRFMDEYSEGDDPNHQWFPFARDRYRQLGRDGIMQSGIIENTDKSGQAREVQAIPSEGRDLVKGLQTGALSVSLERYLRMIASANLGTEARHDAAHSLLHMLLSYANIHFAEVMIGENLTFERFKGQVVYDQKTNTYKVQAAGGRPLSKISRMPRNRLPNVTLKCPAHIDTSQYGETNLQTICHAAINKAFELGLV